MKYTLLALGDSYTIGEKVEPELNFPHQTVTLLNKKESIEFEKPTIIAQTGWTTQELNQGILDAEIDDQTFDFVTLLIGVNNQYRGLSLEEYKEEFSALLKKAIAFAGNRPERVIVLSIPDYSVTPYTKEKNLDAQKIIEELTTFNKAKNSISIQNNVNYIDITFSTQFHGTSPEYLVEDGLHYSAKEYSIWAERLYSIITEQLNTERV